MAKLRYDVCVGRKGKEDKTYWTKIGVVLQGDKGFSLKLESVPVGWDGWASLFEPKKDGAKGKPQTGGNSNSFDDDIPL